MTNTPNFFSKPTQPTAPVDNTVRLQSPAAQEIKALYRNVLGREVEDSEIIFWLNLQIKPEELTRRMLNSQEHVDILSARTELVETRVKDAEIELESKKNKKLYEDVLMQNKTLVGLIDEKNLRLREVEQRVGELSDREKSLQQTLYNLNKRNRKSSFFSRIYDTISRIF